MRRGRALLMAAFVFLFFAEGQRALFASLFGLAYDALFPTFRAETALMALLPLTAVLAPMVPLARWVDRRGAVALAAAGVAICRVPMMHPALVTRLVGGALVVAFAGVFLVWAVGLVDRRAMAAGAALGLVIDQLLRLAGTSYDLSLQPGWLPVQTLASLALLGLAIAWTRDPEAGGDPGADPDGLERRGAGLRLRGALALGGLLFADLHVLSLAPVAARWTGVDYAAVAVVLAAAGGVAVAVALLVRRPTHSRGAALLLTGLATGAMMAGYWLDGPLVLGLMALGHAAVLVLVGRALEPASGRRAGRMVSAGLGVFVLSTAAYALSFYPSYTLPFMSGAAPWVFLAAGLVVAGGFVLLPRPAALDPASSPLPAAAVALATMAAALLLRPADVVSAPAARDGELRVVTWNIHYGFDETWRFDPGAMADALVESGADVMALQEVAVGMPTAYGVDLALWLGRRTGNADHFSATINGLMGDAFLTRLPGSRVDGGPLPAHGGERKQWLRLRAPVADAMVSIHALHLSVDPAGRPAQLEAALERVGDGPTILLGDLNAAPGSPVVHRLQTAGFTDALAGTGPDQRATFPASAPTERIDWIWIRGLRAGGGAEVLPATPSDHRAVAATLRLAGHRVR